MASKPVRDRFSCDALEAAPVLGMSAAPPSSAAAVAPTFCLLVPSLSPSALFTDAFFPLAFDDKEGEEFVALGTTSIPLEELLPDDGD